MISLREFPGDPMRSSFELEIEKIFSPEGLLSAASHYEYRPEQQRMACEVARALQASGHVVIEAGTGVGKSLAYLVPSALHAVRAEAKGSDLNSYDRSPGAAYLQGHPPRPKTAAHRIRGGPLKGATQFPLRHPA